MNERSRQFYDKLAPFLPEQLRLELQEWLEKQSEIEASYFELSSEQIGMAKLFQNMKDKLEESAEENAVLKMQVEKLAEQIDLRNRDIFGKSTEQTSRILYEALNNERAKNPIAEETDTSNEESADKIKTACILEPSDIEGSTGKTNAEGSASTAEDAAPGENADKDETAKDVLKKLMKKEKRKKKNTKSGNKRINMKEQMDNLPRRTEYLIDVEKLNQLYGANNWSIVSWYTTSTIERTRPVTFLHEVKTPIISAGLEHVMHREPAPVKLMKHSFASASLVASIMYAKFVNGVPFYRQSQDLERNSFLLPRETMDNWCIKFGLDLLGPVYDHMMFKLLERNYNQSDETPLNVLKNKGISYIWVHTTGELDNGPKIILYSYDTTRSTDHLRATYLSQGFTGFLTSDGYSAYGTLAKESNGVIVSTGCMMHARRRFVQALLIMPLKGKGAEQIMNLPEFKTQDMINEIYALDTELKEKAEEERAKGRDTKVKEKVDEFFTYLHELDNHWDPGFSERFRDAVGYSLNNEAQLRRFVEDPRIPIDNGFVERAIKPFAIGRNNWLFCCSADGAQALSIFYTLSETAKANGSHPEYYYKYLLEEMSRYIDGTHTDEENLKFLDSMMPWSEEYHQYEVREKRQDIESFIDTEPVVVPALPKVNRRPLKASVI